MKNGAIRGLGSTLSYLGREYISVTMFKGFVSQLFFSCTGTSGISSSVGSSASQAQPFSVRNAPTAFSCSAGTQPWKYSTVSSVRTLSAHCSLAASAPSPSA